MVQGELRSRYWKETFKTEKEEKACVDELSKDKVLYYKMRRTLPDEMSDRKWETKDKLFYKLGYGCIVSLFVEQTESQKELRMENVTEANTKLVKNQDGGEHIYSHWRTSAVEDLWKDSKQEEVKFGLVLYPHDNLSLFHHEIAVVVAHVVLGFVSDVEGQ